MVKTKKAKVELTMAQITEAATNDVALSLDEFELGGRIFKVMHLEHHDYLTFLVLIEPLMQGIITFSMSQAKVSIPGVDMASFSITDMITKCSHNLSKLAQLVCKQSDTTITVDEVEKLCPSPFKLAKVVALQIAKNNIIAEFQDFFLQTVPKLIPR